MTVTKAKEQAADPSASAEVSSPFNETLKVALYGKFGSCKTLQAGHLIQLVGPENVLVVNAERGLGTIRSKLTKADRIISVTNMNELRAAFGPVQEFAQGGPQRWVVVDGMSSIVEWLANDQLSGAERYYDAKVLNQTIPNALLPMGRFLTDKGSIDTMRIYGRIGRDSENLLNAWIALPCNLYVNYLEDLTGSSGYEKTYPLGPDVPGRVGLKAVMSSFDFIGRLSYNADGQLLGGFDARSNLYLARTREDRTVVQIPTEIPEFRLDEFVKLVRGEKPSE